MKKPPSARGFPGRVRVHGWQAAPLPLLLHLVSNTREEAAPRRKTVCISYKGHVSGITWPATKSHPGQSSLRPSIPPRRCAEVPFAHRWPAAWMEVKGCLSISWKEKETEPKRLSQDSPWLKGNGAPAHVFLSMETVLGLLRAPSPRRRLAHQNRRKHVSREA